MSHSMYRDPQNQLIPPSPQTRLSLRQIMSVVSRYLSQDRGIDDILSGLPRHVLDKIFGRLPVQDAARTCILSKKWRYIWAMYPYLVLDAEFFDWIFSVRGYYLKEFIKAVNQILFHHDVPILRFHIHIPNFFGDLDEHIERWLLFVSNNGVKQLIVDYNSPNKKLSSYVFSCPNLTYLELNYCVYKPPVTFSEFANLVEIYFSRVAFAANKYDGRSPLAPMMSTMTFTSCCGLEYFNISAPQLKKLIVHYSHEVNPNFFEKFPNLTIIDIRLGKRLKAFYQGKGRLIRFSELHKKSPRMETFCCDGYFLNLSAPTRNQMRPSFRFQFLTILQFDRLSFADSNQTRSVIWLLNCTPSLQKFIAWISKEGTAVQSGLTLSKPPPGCVEGHFNLQSLELNCVKGAHELVFIQCILAYSPNLEYLRVKYGVTNADQKLIIFRTLMKFHRASARAVIKFVG